ncbi:MAG: hypothetical protein ACLT33_12025 [Lachnospira pectinoschiza]
MHRNCYRCLTGVVNIIVVLFNVLIGFIVAAYLLTAEKSLQSRERWLSIVYSRKNGQRYGKIKYTDKVFSGLLMANP